MRPFAHAVILALVSALPCLSQEGDPSTFELRASWSPIASSTYQLYEQEPLKGLLAACPAEESSRYGYGDIEPLCPPAGLAVGEVYTVEEEALLPFLRQLHPGATMDLHHHTFPAHFFADIPPERRDPRYQETKPGMIRNVDGPFGIRAVLLDGDGPLDILLRAHPEFQFAEGTFFTPSQFEGRLVVDTGKREVLHFSLRVPDRKTNVDMNTTTGADIGHVPNLSLSGGPGPAPKGDASATLVRARRSLEIAFYGSWADLEWLPLPEAIAESRRLERPLHLVVLFGTLADESC